jgi:large subunit ribosomal protein L15
MENQDQMRLHNLKPAPGSRKDRKRVGRGESAGGGKTCGRGQKGQKARSKTRLGFEGGQMPLARRVPKLGGFTPRRRNVFAVVNVSELSRFETGEVDPEALAEVGLIRKKTDRVKVLGNGELNVSITVKAHAFTGSAREKIEAAGGKAEVI